MKKNENRFFCSGKKSEKFGYYLEQIWFRFGKIPTSSILSSSSMTTADKVGLSITIIAFGIIMSPLALSDSDPYHVKWLLEDTRDTFVVIGNFIISQGDDETSPEKQYRVIAHLKMSINQPQGDLIEKSILGKLKSKTS